MNSDNIPNTTAIELSQNRLATLDGLSALAEKVPNVKILHLCENNVRKTELSACLNF